MSDAINDSGFIEWLRGLFEDATAEAMFGWVVVAWLALVVAMVVLDRFGTGLLGRSRPLAQVPPERARTWRWGRRTPPDTYSRLPTGMIDVAAHRPAPVLAESIPLSRRPMAALAMQSAVVTTTPNVDYWRDSADVAAPLFGYENNDRLESGSAPERYNPITGRVESLDRNETTGVLAWPGDPASPVVLGRFPDPHPLTVPTTIDLRDDDPLPEFEGELREVSADEDDDEADDHQPEAESE